MRALTIIPAVVLLFSISVSLANDSTITQIRKEYQAIRSALPILKMESIALFGYSTEGGEAKVYRDAKGNVRLIQVEFFGESGKTFEEYYYQNGSLIFVFNERHDYNVPFYVTPELAKEIGSDEYFDGKKTKITENRYYFNGGKMIRWLNKEKEKVDTKSEVFRETEKQIMDFSNEMLTKVKRKP